MVATTRAAARQLSGAASARNTLEKQPDVETGRQTDDSCRILELPAELRNYIYEYCSENLDDTKYAPRIARKKCKPWAQRTWNFFGFTQTCKQIRTEHRSIWIYSLSVLSTVRVLTDFIDNFLSEPDHSMYAPRRMQIEWDHGLHDLPGDKHNLTRLAQLQVHVPTMRITFVPSKLVSSNAWAKDMCWHCMYEDHAENPGHEGFNNPVEECTCAPLGMDPEDWETYQYDLISRTNILRALICHTNTTWSQSLRNNLMNIECVFARSADPIEFRILCKERFCEAELSGDTSVHAEKALELLKVWGILEHPVLKEMNLIVVFFTKQKTKKEGYEMLSSELREVHVTHPKAELAM